MLFHMREEFIIFPMVQTASLFGMHALGLDHNEEQIITGYPIDGAIGMGRAGSKVIDGLFT